jgi:hypothetical protein
MRNGGPRRAKGADGEREAARTIMANCPSLRADRNARNGKACSDVIVWVDGDEKHPTIFEVKRVESLDIGTKAMDKIRQQSIEDNSAGILWRPNNKPWRLDCMWYGVWVTFSGDEVWRQVERLVAGP